MDRFDIVEVVGIVLLVVGAGLAWLPAAFIVGGVACIVEAQVRSLGTPDTHPDDESEAT